MRRKTLLITTLTLLVLMHGRGQTASALDPKLPTVFVIGDSTASNNGNGLAGWGDPFRSYFDQTKLNVVNRARAGRSSRTFQTEELWDRVFERLEAG